MQIRHITKKGNSFELHIRKRKDNLTNALCRMIIRPNLTWGKFCPVKILDDYLSTRLGLHPASGSDWLFPSLNSNFSPFNSSSVSLSVSSTQFLFDNYYKRLQIHLDTAELRNR